MKKILLIAILCLAFILGFETNVFAAGVAKIGDTTYDTLDAALAGVGTEATITIIDNIDLPGKATIPAGKKVVLDLNGKTLKVPTVENNYGIVVKGDLTIKGKGTVTLGMYGIGVAAGGNLTVESGTYNCPTGDYLIGVWGTATIKGGTFNGNYCIANGFDNGKIEILDGTFYSHEDTIVLGGVTIKGGAFNHDVTDYLADGVKMVLYNGVYFTGTVYNITIETAKNGKVEAVKTAVDGQPVKLTITPNKGYELDKINVTKTDGTQVGVENNEFMMPKSDVKVMATFKVSTLDNTPQTGNLNLLMIASILLTGGILVLIITKKYKVN